LLEQWFTSFFSTAWANLGKLPLKLGLMKTYVEMLDAKGGIFDA